MKPDADGVMTCPVSGARFVIENTQEPHEQR
jgi:hypothetical protein